MFEMTHPAPTSLLMCQTNTTKTNIYNDLVTNHSFSFNCVRIHGRIFPLITIVINFSGLLMGDVYPKKKEKNLLEKFKNNKEIINLYFKNNPEEVKKY